MRSHVDCDATEGCQTGSPQVASNSVYGIISGASYEYQRLSCQTSWTIDNQIYNTCNTSWQCSDPVSSSAVPFRRSTGPGRAGLLEIITRRTVNTWSSATGKPIAVCLLHATIFYWTEILKMAPYVTPSWKGEKTNENWYIWQFIYRRDRSFIEMPIGRAMFFTVFIKANNRGKIMCLVPQVVILTILDSYETKLAKVCNF